MLQLPRRKPLSLGELRLALGELAEVELPDGKSFAKARGQDLGNATAGAPARGNLDIESVAGAIRDMLADGPRYYAEISDLYAGESFQTVSRAIVSLQESNDLWQDDVGRLCLKDSPVAARPPTRK